MVVDLVSTERIYTSESIKSRCLIKTYLQRPEPKYVSCQWLIWFRLLPEAACLTHFRKSKKSPKPVVLENLYLRCKKGSRWDFSSCLMISTSSYEANVSNQVFVPLEWPSLRCNVCCLPSPDFDQINHACVSSGFWPFAEEQTYTHKKLPLISQVRAVIVVRVSLKAKITSRSFCQIIVLTLWTTTNEKSGTECKRSESKSCGLPQITDLALIYDHLLARWMEKKLTIDLLYMCVFMSWGEEGKA